MLPLLRYTLDLFGSDAAAPAPTKPKGPSKPRARKLPTPGRANGVPDGAGLPDPHGQNPPLIDSVGVAFRHPRANRQSTIAGVAVAYEFTRARRRTIGFVIGPDGLAVRAPRWTPLHEVEAALQEKGRWVLRKLQESQALQQRRDQARIIWSDGVSFPYLGEDITVQLDPTQAFTRRGAVSAELSDALQVGASCEGMPPRAAQPRRLLRVGLPSQASAQQIRDAVQAWLMQQAKALFEQRLQQFAPQLGVQWQRLSLSSAATRWGSATSKGHIRLNWRLIHFRLAVVDYVVVHELSHLRVMDHSPRFWDTVASVVPDYADLRGQLKDDTVPRW